MTNDPHEKRTASPNGISILGTDETSIVHSINQILAKGAVPQAIVMPSQGLILALQPESEPQAETTAEARYKPIRRFSPAAMAKALKALGFFPDKEGDEGKALGVEVPEKLITPVEGANPKYSVANTVHPEGETTYRLITVE